jgi:hypothetical protein
VVGAALDGGSAPPTPIITSVSNLLNLTHTTRETVDRHCSRERPLPRRFSPKADWQKSTPQQTFAALLQGEIF